jgi:glycogen(starch) synthase
MSAASPGAGRGLLGNSVALLAMSHITALLGYVFWMVCTHRVSAAAIGMSSTVISAMSLVAVLTAAGFVPLLTRALPGANPEERSGLCSTAIVLTVVVSGIGGVVGALLLPAGVHAVVGTFWLVGLLGAGAVGTALLLVINAALLGIRRAEFSLLGSVVASMARLAIVMALLVFGLLVVDADSTVAHTILTLWAASLAISFALSWWLLARAVPDFSFRPGLVWLPRLRRGVAWEHATTVSARVPGLAMPILAAAQFPAALVGYFSLTWMVSTAFFAVSSAGANALLADCADRPERLRGQTRRALQFIGLLLVAPVAVTSLLSTWILGLFGAAYARNGSTLLILLLLSTLPDAVVNIGVAVLRLRGRLVATAAVTVAQAIIALSAAWLLMRHLGIAGAGWAILISDLVMAAVLLVVACSRGWVRPRTVDPHPKDTIRMPMTSPDGIQRTAEPLRGLRILHATESFLPNVGGLELSIAALVRAQVARGQAVAVVAPPHPEAANREALGGAEIYRLPMTMAHVPGAYIDRTHLFFPPVPDPQFAHAFADIIRHFRPDVVHARGWILYSVLGASRRAGVPVVATAHDHSQVCATKTMLYEGRSLCSGPGLRKCMRCAFAHYGPKGIPLAAGLHQLGSRRHRDVAHWMAISSALAARGSAPRRADRSAIEVIPTFIDDDLLVLAADERTAGRPDFVPAIGPYLFYAGALGTHKGVDVLLDAHRRLHTAGVDVPLVLAGLPRPDFRVPRQPRVTVVDCVPHAAVMAAWRHAIVGVVPSLVPEGFGRVAVECLAAGTPCVVSATGGLLDVVDDGLQGLHVPPGDAATLAGALRLLLEDEPLRLRLGAAGPAKAAHFALSQVLPRLDEVYRNVLDEAGAHYGDRSRSGTAPLSGRAPVT